MLPILAIILLFPVVDRLRNYVFQIAVVDAPRFAVEKNRFDVYLSKRLVTLPPSTPGICVKLEAHQNG